MSMLKAPQTSRRHQLREDQLATAAAASVGFFEEHRNQLIGVAVGLLVIIAGAFAYSLWQNSRDTEAAEMLGNILTTFEQGQLAEALDGTADTPGLLEIADRYGSTATGNLATFYAADALYQLGRFDEALEYFENHDAGGDILGASALAGQAAVHEQRGDNAEAAQLFRRAADAYDSPATTPDYLMSAGRNYEAAGDATEAEEVYQQFLDDYGDTPSAPLVEALIARAEAGGGN